jgi:hypothetical protein
MPAIDFRSVQMQCKSPGRMQNLSRARPSKRLTRFQRFGNIRLGLIRLRPTLRQIAITITILPNGVPDPKCANVS